MFSILGRRMTFLLAIVLGMCWIFFALWIVGRERSLVLDQLRSRAESIYQYAVVTRRWIAFHKGIYVKRNGEYLLITPYGFTRDLAKYSKNKLPYEVKMAILKPSNPVYRADDFETMAIKKMVDNGGEPVWKVEKASRGTVFRFAAPLPFTQECANCHRYYQSHIAACVSVTLPASRSLEVLNRDRVHLFIIILVFMMVVFVILVSVLEAWVIEPLTMFVEISNRVSKGDLQVRMEESRSDEWGGLASSSSSLMKSIPASARSPTRRAVASTERPMLGLMMVPRIGRSRTPVSRRVPSIANWGPG